MRKKPAVVIPAALLVLACALFFYDSTEPVRSPATADQVSSVSFYYFNMNSKKEVSGQADISAILGALGQSRSHGPYGRIPDGGQSFLILLHLKDGSSLPCVYYQTEKSSGYYTDGTTNIRVSSLDLREVWEGLDCGAVQASPDQEFDRWPALTL